MQKMTIRLDEDVCEEVRKLSETQDISFSQCANSLLKTALESQKTHQDSLQTFREVVPDLPQFAKIMELLLSNVLETKYHMRQMLSENSGDSEEIIAWIKKARDKATARANELMSES